MKKIVLFTLLCVGILNGMESYSAKAVGQGSSALKDRPEGIGMQDLPIEVKKLILMYTYEVNNLEEAIYHIKKATLINKELSNIINDIKGFTALVHELADKFDMTTVDVANEFNMPIAEKYLKLGHELFDSAESSYQSKNRMARLIKEGADVNFNNIYNTPLKKAITNLNNEGIKILLEFGVKPTKEDLLRIEEIEKLHPPKE